MQRWLERYGPREQWDDASKLRHHVFEVARAAFRQRGGFIVVMNALRSGQEPAGAAEVAAAPAGEIEGAPSTGCAAGPLAVSFAALGQGPRSDALELAQFGVAITATIHPAAAPEVPQLPMAPRPSQWQLRTGPAVGAHADRYQHIAAVDAAPRHVAPDQVAPPVARGVDVTMDELRRSALESGPLCPPWASAVDQRGNMRATRPKSSAGTSPAGSP